jgi:hypothetical protein
MVTGRSAPGRPGNRGRFYDWAMTITEIVASIDRRLTLAQAEITKLKSARTQLVNGGVAARPAVSKPRPRRPKPRPAVRVQVVPQGVLEKILGENPDSTTSQLARIADADRGQVLTLLKELERADRVRRSGQRAATRWRRFTDEDAIAERAVELSSRTRKPNGRKAQTVRGRTQRMSAEKRGSAARDR